MSDQANKNSNEYLSGTRNGSTLTMRERVDPEFIQFKAGSVLEGVLVRVEKITVQTKPAIRYTVNGGGKLYCFLGTYQINSKLFPVDVNHWIKVKYVGEDSTVTRGENSMRIFEISVSEEAVGVGEFHATDDDVAF